MSVDRSALKLAVISNRDIIKSYMHPNRENYVKELYPSSFPEDEDFTHDDDGRKRIRSSTGAEGDEPLL